MSLWKEVLAHSLFNMNKKGFTLIEIIVGAVILALVMAGLASVFLASKKYIVHSQSRMSGGELGKVFLDYLQMHVRQDTWDNVATNALSVTTAPNVPRYCDAPSGNPQQPGCPTQAQRTLDPSISVYTARYDIDANVSGAPNLRRVKVTISWTE